MGQNVRNKGINSNLNKKNNFTFGHVKERVRVCGWFMVGMVRVYEKCN